MLICKNILIMDINLHVTTHNSEIFLVHCFSLIFKSFICLCHPGLFNSCCLIMTFPLFLLFFAPRSQRFFYLGMIKIFICIFLQ